MYNKIKRLESFFDYARDILSANFDSVRKYFDLFVQPEESPGRNPQSEKQLLLLNQNAVFMLGVCNEDSAELLPLLRSYRLSTNQDLLRVTKLGEVSPQKNVRSYLFVNVDALGDLEDAVQELASFRKRHPKVFVVMFSADVLTDDFGSHRKSICDVTLRSPITENRIESALNAVHQNYLQTSGAAQQWQASREVIATLPPACAA